MKIIKTAAAMQREIKKIKNKRSIGFVPTMGYLHEGHLSLVQKSRKANQITVVSIYVNPTQFGPKEDFSRYPRDLERDYQMLRREKVDFVFVPDNQQMYPDGFETFVEAGDLAKPLCGQNRPGHFRGVLTVVSKLFHIVNPDRVYFGQKDFQQALLIQQMIKDLNFDIQMKVCPIVRESDGLAMSSRNRYLSPEQRQKALSLSRVLKQIRRQIREGETSISKLKREALQILEENDCRIEYLEFRDTDKLLPLRKISGKILIAVAAKVGKVRLIDNIVIRS